MTMYVNELMKTDEKKNTSILMNKLEVLNLDQDSILIITADKINKINETIFQNI